MKSCRELVAHTEEDLVETMQRDKKELRDKIESESSDVKRKMELETNEMRDRLQSEKKAASVAMEEEVEERRRDINQIRQTVRSSGLRWGGRAQILLQSSHDQVHFVSKGVPELPESCHYRVTSVA